MKKDEIEFILSKRKGLKFRLIASFLIVLVIVIIAILIPAILI